MITKQQMADMQEHAEHCEDERAEQRFWMEDQPEDHRMQMQMQMQQKFLTTMMMMMNGNNVFSNAGLACNTLPPSIPPIQTEDGRDGQNGEPNNGEPNSGEG